MGFRDCFRPAVVPAASLAIALAGWVGRSAPAIAQVPDCTPPRAGEYLLLVLSEGEDDPAIVRRLLTPQLAAVTCTYLDETVVRVSGFGSQEAASALARQITQESGLAAFVTRPPADAPPVARPPAPASPVPAAPEPGLLELPTVEVVEARPAGERSRPAPEPEVEESEDEDDAFDLDLDPSDLPPADLPDGDFDVPPPDASDTAGATDDEDLTVYVPVPNRAPVTGNPTAPAPIPGMPTTPQTALNPAVTGYNPQPLAGGYAVLVDYFNQTQLAGQVQQLTNRSVGLVSYGQRPYLLAGYSASEAEANVLFQQLSSNGFWTMVVDSQRVMLLTPQVQN